MPIQAGVENLNRDLHQLSGIRYEPKSFSFRCLVSLAYREGLISGVNLSVLVPQNPPDMNKILEIYLVLTESDEGLSQPQSCTMPRA